MDDNVILIISILISFILTFFNVTTIVIAIIDHKIRLRTSNYPVISFLLASTFQGMFAAPIHAYKHMEHMNHLTGWVCDLTRLSHYLCHHLVKVSIVVISFDRLFSIKFPYKYNKYGTKGKMVTILAICWILTILVDMMPFIHNQDDEVCHYVPNKQWILFIIIVYNMTPFILIAINYIIIWRVGVAFALYDHNQQTGIRQRCKKISKSRSPDLSKENLKSRRKKRINQCMEKSKLKVMFEVKATKTSLILIGIYVFCWGPLGTYMIIINICEKCLSLND